MRAASCGAGRTAVAPQFDDDRAAHLRERREVRQPLRARHQKAVHEQQVRTVAVVRFEVQLCIGARVSDGS